MASKQDNTEARPASGRKIELIALLVLAGLALADLGTILYLRVQRASAPLPPVAQTQPAPTPSGPEFDVVRVDPQGNTVLAGRAVPGALVTVKDNGAVLGTVTADAQGAFVLLPATPLPPGAHNITMSEKLPDGSQLASAESASVSVPGNGGQVLTILSGTNGSTVLSGQGPEAGTLALGAVDYDTSGHAIFSGTAPAGAKISLSLGGKPIGTAVADAKGRWHITAPTPESGTLVLNATGADGKQLPVATAPFAPETLKDALASGHVVITPGDCLWLVAKHAYGEGTKYTLIYAANAGQIHDPNLIFPGQSLVLPTNKAN